MNTMIYTARLDTRVDGPLLTSAVVLVAGVTVEVHTCQQHSTAIGPIFITIRKV